MRHLKEALYGIVVIALLAGLTYYADPAQVAATLANANLHYAALGVLTGIVALLVRVKKWAVLLEKSFIETAHSQIAGVTISNFTPGKIAEPVKAILLKKRAGVDVSKSLPSIFWERVVDLSVVMILSLFVFTTLPLGGNLRVLSFSGIAIFGGIALVAIAVIYNQRFGRIIFRIARKFPILNRLSENFIENFYSVRVKKRNVGKCFFWTFAAWLLDSVTFYITFLALGVDPLGIAGVGSVAAVSLVFLFRIMTFWLSVFVGMISLFYLGRKADVFEAVRKARI